MSRKPSRCMLVAKVLIGRWLACCLFLEVFWEPLLLCFVPQKFNYLKQVAQLRPGVEPLRSKGAVLRMTRGGAWLPIVCWDGLLLVVILAGTPLLGDPRQCSPTGDGVQSQTSSLQNCEPYKLLPFISTLPRTLHYISKKANMLCETEYKLGSPRSAISL